MSPENSFITENDFNMSVNDLYERNRREFYGSDESKPFDYIYGTDLIFGSSDISRDAAIMQCI